MKRTFQSSWFSHPQNNRQIKGAWERFLSGDEYSSSVGLRPTIDASWRRCLVSHIDPSRNQAQPPMGISELEALRKRHERLISASAPFMVQSRSFLAQTGTVMVLTDPEGTILDVEGDQRLREAIERIRLIPGSFWNESATGTNAIGTALALGKPIQVHASEHFCEGIQKWSCSAAVIRDPANGSILGALDISGLSGTYSHHSLPLVAMTAERIENRLAQLEMERRFGLLELSVPRLSSADGVMVFDCHGNLVKANEKAAAALAAWDVALSAETRIPVLNSSGAAPSSPNVLPDWLLANRIEPVFWGPSFLGFIVSIPLLPPDFSQASAPIVETASVSTPEKVPTPEETLLATILDHSASLVSLKDMTGRYEFVSRRFEEVFNVRSADILGKTDAEVFNIELAQTLRARDLEAMGLRVNSESVDELKLDSGKIYLAAVRFPILDSAGATKSFAPRQKKLLPPRSMNTHA